MVKKLENELLKVAGDIARYGNEVRPFLADEKHIAWSSLNKQFELKMQAVISHPIYNDEGFSVVWARLGYYEPDEGADITVDVNRPNTISDDDGFAEFILNGFRTNFKPNPNRLYIPYIEGIQSPFSPAFISEANNCITS